jgi:hypothetical protein
VSLCPSLGPSRRSQKVRPSVGPEGYQAFLSTWLFDSLHRGDKRVIQFWRGLETWGLPLPSKRRTFPKSCLCVLDLLGPIDVLSTQTYRPHPAAESEGEWGQLGDAPSLSSHRNLAVKISFVHTWTSGNVKACPSTAQCTAGPSAPV